jgi:diguanylate cyclase (GGDEF)-like protein
MLPEPFVDAYRDVNLRFQKMLEAVSALRELSSVSLRHDSEQTLINNALQILLKHQDMDHLALFLARDDQLELAGQLGRDGDRQLPFVQSAEFKPLLKEVAGRGESRRLDAGDGADQFPSLKFEGSIMLFPLGCDQCNLGVLCISHPHADLFTLDHERVVQIYCNYFARMVQMHRLMSDMEHQVSERTSQLEQALHEAYELKERYETLSVIDDLTELHNRRYLYPQARTALARAIRVKQPLSVLLVDLDHFKFLNERYGHVMGDRVLHDIGTLLSSTAREADLLARYSGEEFVFVLPDTGDEGARVKAERVRKSVKTLRWSHRGDAIQTTVTIGITTLANFEQQESQALLEQLIREADSALLQGKRRGRDCIQSYQLPG